MSQVKPPLKRLEFVKSLIENVLGDNLRLFTGGGHEAGGGNGVDLPGNAGGELVDQVFDVGAEGFFGSAGSFEMEVNVRSGLRFGKRPKVVMYRDALSEVGKDVSFEAGGFDVGKMDVDGEKLVERDL